MYRTILCSRNTNYTYILISHFRLWEAVELPAGIARSPNLIGKEVVPFILFQLKSKATIRNSCEDDRNSQWFYGTWQKSRRPEAAKLFNHSVAESDKYS